MKRYLRISSLLLFLEFCLGLQVSAYANSFFTVKKIEGTVLYRYPLSTKWKKCKPKQKFGEHALIQTTFDSRIQLEYNSKSYFKGQARTIYIQKPMIVRLDQGLFRSIEQKSLYMDRLPEISLEAEEMADQDLQGAWNKVFMFLKDNVIPEQLLMLSSKDLENKDLLAGDFNSDFQILTPPPGLEMKVNLPFQLPVRWSAPNSYKGRYKIFLAKEGEKFTEPIITTRSTNHLLTIHESGQYKIKVVAEQSNKVALAESLRVIDKNNNPTKHQNLDNILYGFIDWNLVNEKLLVSAKGKPKTTIYLSWQFVGDIEPEYFMLGLMSKGNHSLNSDYKTTEQNFALSVQPGEYVATVSAVFKGLRSTIQSVPLEIYVSSQSYDSVAMISKVFAAKNSGTVILEP